MSRYPAIDAKLKLEEYQTWLQNTCDFHTSKNTGGSFKDYCSRLVRCILIFNSKLTSEPIPNFEDLLPRLLASNLGNEYIDLLFVLLEERTRLSLANSPSLKGLIIAINKYKEWINTQGFKIVSSQRLNESELAALTHILQLNKQQGL